MTGLKSKPRPTNFQVIKLSLHYFAILSRYKTFFVLIVVLSTIVKNYILSQTNKIKMSLKHSKSIDEIKSAFIKTSLFNSQWAGMNFLTDAIFQKHLIAYGGYIATRVFKGILFTDARITNDTPGIEFEYYVTEGGKALAKISRFIIFAFFSKIFHFCFDLINIMAMDTTENKMATKTYLVVLLILMLTQIVQLKKIGVLEKVTVDVALDKEKTINETVDNIAIIKAYGAEDHAVLKFRKESYKWEKCNMHYKFWFLTSNFLYSVSSSSSRYAIAIFYLLYSRSKTNNNSDIFGFLEILHEMLVTMNGAVGLFKEMAAAIESTYECIEYMDLCTKIIEKKPKVMSFQDKIEVKDLIYQTNGKLVFSGVNFTIKKGDKIALHGKNGTGKSSIFKLILGFDDYKGQILFDSHNIDLISMPEYRDCFTYVPQDTKLFDESIYYNLVFGNNKSYKEIIDECKKMRIHDIIMTFPKGYNTYVGEGGKYLNGGLRQKIFYTRALLCDTEIYMFDEPTNNLDFNHSQFLQEYLNDPKYAEKTFFVICHDLEMVRKFKKIFHFSEGKIETLETI